jgi:hypothetical protein
VSTKSGKPERKRAVRTDAARRPTDSRRASRPSPAPSKPPRSKSPSEAASPRTTRRPAFDTLAAIAEELNRARMPAPRAKLDTLGYEDRPREPRTSRFGSSPELITIEEAPIGRSTQHAIQAELAGGFMDEEPPPHTGVVSVPAPAEIFEISTFIVQGDEIYSKASEASRRAFVAERLLHRLPMASMEDVARIDVSRGPIPRAIILRVWTKVKARA